MSTYKLVDSDKLDSDLKSVADTIREKSGMSDKLVFPEGYNTAIRSIQGSSVGDRYDEGYNDGYSTGFSEGRIEGYDEGYTKGLLDGDETGYQKGYNEGYNAGRDSFDTWEGGNY